MGERYLFPDVIDVVSAQQLSIALEVGGEPKPGNVTRNRPFPEISYDDFLLAAASIEEPLVERYEEARRRFNGGEDFGGVWGEALLKSSRNSVEGRSNTIFGTLLLEIPLGLGACIARKRGEVVKYAERVVNDSNVQDSIAFVRSVRLCRIGGLMHEDLTGSASALDLNMPGIEEKIMRRGIVLRELLSLSQEYDLLAAELLTGFKIIQKCAGKYIKELRRLGDPNRASAMIFCSLLSNHPDSLIRRKAGEEVAEEIRSRAEESMRLLAFSPQWIRAMKDLDESLRRRDLNPGTLADITAASIFLALLGEIP